MRTTSSLETASTAQLERDLVDRHRRGERSAFEEYYQEHSQLVYNLALRLSGNATEAQDLTQEVFLRIFKNLHGFHGRSSLKTWTYRVCINHCRSKLARKRPQTKSLTTEDGEMVDVVDPARGPESMASAQADRRVLAEALARLDQRFREAVVLRDLEGLSYREVAEALEVPVGTVRSRLARGRAHLKAVLEEGL